MIGVFAASLALMVGVLPQQVDTTLSVANGTKLRVETNAGSVHVDTWTRSSVRVIASGSDRPVDVHYGGGEVSVGSGWPTSSGRLSYRISVPRWMGLHIETRSADIAVAGADGEVVAQTMEGRIDVRGGKGLVQVGSVGGTIDVSDAEARVHAETVGGSVHLRNVTGDIDAETVNGGVTLSGVNSDNVQASTVNGGVSFHGAIHPSGYYHLSSHNGPVRIFVSRPPDATIKVTAFNNSFDTDFPLRLTSTSGGRHMTFVIGSGSARVELDSFNGPVVLGRTGGPKDGS